LPSLSSEKVHPALPSAQRSLGAGFFLAATGNWRSARASANSTKQNGWEVGCESARIFEASLNNGDRDTKKSIKHFKQ
jgi:hypothetical protein